MNWFTKNRASFSAEFLDRDALSLFGAGLVLVVMVFLSTGAFGQGHASGEQAPQDGSTPMIDGDQTASSDDDATGPIDWEALEAFGAERREDAVALGHDLLAVIDRELAELDKQVEQSVVVAQEDWQQRRGLIGDFRTAAEAQLEALQRSGEEAWEDARGAVVAEYHRLSDATAAAWVTFRERMQSDVDTAPEGEQPSGS